MLAELMFPSPEEADRARELLERLAARMEAAAPLRPRAFVALEQLWLPDEDHRVVVRILKMGPGALGEDDPAKVRALKDRIAPVAAPAEGTMTDLELCVELDRLVNLDLRRARICSELQAGRTLEEAALILGLDPKEVRADWENLKAEIARGRARGGESG